MTRWIDQPAHRSWLQDQFLAQLTFGKQFPHADGGAHYLTSDGRPDTTQPVHTWVTARMLHVYALGHLAGLPGMRPLAERALAGITGPLRDAEHGGWFASVGPDADRRDETKAGYAHAFVVFGAASGAIAGLPGARDVLAEALEVLDKHFWEEDHGLHVDSFPASWGTAAAYRGVNANMHAVEALLSAADATGDARWRERALRITRTVLGWAAANDWRIPEHFDSAWTPLLEHHRDQPDHPFEPYGATVGHGLEWARLALHVRAAVEPTDASLLAGAENLFDRAVTDGWHDGFVYTTDWSGRPVVTQRMHWVVAEAISAASALEQATGKPRYEELYRRYWDWAAQHLVGPDGSWQHELDEHNQPATTVWPGRPDLYHSVHAVLLPRLPLAPTAPTALARGLLT